MGHILYIQLDFIEAFLKLSLSVSLREKLYNIVLDILCWHYLLYVLNTFVFNKLNHMEKEVAYWI